MFEFLSRLFAFAEDAPKKASERRLDTAIEAVMDGTAPRLRLVSDYKKKLRPPTQTAVAFVQELASGLGAPADLSRAAFSADPRIHALFGSPDSLQNLVSRDANVRAFVEDPGFVLLPEFHALLMARRSQKRILGARLTGQIIQSDVPQTMLSFSEHRLVAVSASETGTLNLVQRGAFRQLVHWALATLTAMKSGSNERHSIMLRERLEALSSFQGGNEHPFWLHPAGHDHGDAAHRLGEIDQRMAECNDPPCSLDDYLAVVADVLSHPERYLRMDTFSAIVDRMSVVLGPEDEGSPGVDRITLSEVVMPDQPDPVVVLPVRLSRGDILPRPELNLDAVY
ncbi:MAG: hypothetical protein PHU46_07530 [Rhodocyclaceae bacterium]|nr:hypothetical protein [Rhodocyclaceae bacterium]